MTDEAWRLPNASVAGIAYAMNALAESHLSNAEAGKELHEAVDAALRLVDERLEAIETRLAMLEGKQPPPPVYSTNVTAGVGTSISYPIAITCTGCGRLWSHLHSCGNP